MTHCFRYESVAFQHGPASARLSLLRTFNRRVVLVNKVALNQLDCKAGFSDATSAYDHQLVFSQELDRKGESARTVLVIRNTNIGVLLLGCE